MSPLLLLLLLLLLLALELELDLVVLLLTVLALGCAKDGKGGHCGIPAITVDSAVPNVIKSKWSRMTVQDWMGCDTVMA